MAGHEKKKTQKIAISMFISFVAASILPLLLIVWWFVQRSTASTEQNLLQLASPYCTQVIDSITAVISEAENEVTVLKRSSAMYDLLFTEYTNPADALSMYQSAWLNNTSHFVNDNHTIKFYNVPSISNISALTNNSLEDFKRVYGDEAAFCDESIHYKLLPSYGTHPLRLALYTSYISPEQQLYLTIEIPFTDILPYMEHGNTLGGFAYLLDSDGQVICSTDSQGIYVNEIATLLRNRTRDGSATYLDGEKFLMLQMPISSHTASSSKGLEWELYYFMPNRLFASSVRSNILALIPLCLCSVLFSMYVAVSYTKWFCNRLRKIKGKTDRILKAEFDIAEPIHNHDELSELEASIYEMSAALETMFANQYERLQHESEQKIRNEQLLRTAVQAQIDALRYQINPHYLFNTMESIRMHLYLNGDKETAHIIRLFSESFRKMLESDNGEYTLRDELDTIQSYLEIQKYRLQDRFDSKIIVEPTVENCIIPKLLIQPLVENAFFHGIELVERSGHLGIVISLRDNFLHIQVSDNGMGMSEEKLNRLRNALDDPNATSRSVGLKNTAQRLKLLYKENQSFHIESIQGEGTTVSLTIPYQLTQKGNTMYESTDRR